MVLQVIKLLVLIGNNDSGNSVRRVVGRMFNDNILSYSLFGFKQKLSFSSLLSYRVIIGKKLKIMSCFNFI